MGLPGPVKLVTLYKKVTGRLAYMASKNGAKSAMKGNFPQSPQILSGSKFADFNGGIEGGGGFKLLTRCDLAFHSNLHTFAHLPAHKLLALTWLFSLKPAHLHTLHVFTQNYLL